MSLASKLPYSEYGCGKDLLFAFHGYGMNGEQFRAMQNSLVAQFRIIAFHLPYHRDGTMSHEGWKQQLIITIRQILDDKECENFSIAGYSIGSRISLHLLQHFHKNIEQVYLFAPYGLEKHYGLQFLSSKIGFKFFEFIINSQLPEFVMKAVKSLGIIDDKHHQIIQKEIDTSQKRSNLNNTLRFTSLFPIETEHIIALLNREEIKAVIVYGKKDVLFPYQKRNRKLLHQIKNHQVLGVDEGHWIMTPKLDQFLTSHLR